MNYLEFTIEADAVHRELLIAELSEMGFEGFEETDTALRAYIPEDVMDNEAFAAIDRKYSLKYETRTILPKNWNETWESSFEPVVVDDFCTIRAGFHSIATSTPYEIVITPKMSFGTGHHATTQLMVREMQHADFRGKSVFDYGTGTGVLAILADKLGAAEVLAIDNDEWSYENAGENTVNNKCKHVNVALGTIDAYTSRSFDIILANINRHILLESMTQMSNMLKNSGLLLMSGLLKEDKDIILQSAESSGLIFVGCNEENGWIVLTYRK